MSNTLVTVLIVNYNTSDFIDISLDALDKLTKNEYKVMICDNGSKYLDKKKLIKVTKKYSNIELLFRKQSAWGSIGHGEALNILIEKTDTKFGVFLDSDAIFLKKNWDEILINQLDIKTRIIGCPPAKNQVKPDDFPSLYATLFDAKTLKDLKIDMRPKDPSIGLDTGWEIREKFLKNNYHSKLLETMLTREYKRGPFKNIICTEYYLKGYNDIFTCHFGRGSTLGTAKYKEHNIFFKTPMIRHVLRKIKGYGEKKEWLDICKDIINKEKRKGI